MLKRYALLIPMLYCDAITDAMIKGLGQQTISVRYNIITNMLDVLLLYLLLPDYGMAGYFASFLVTHAINFGLSLQRLLKITGERLPLHIPVLSLTAGVVAAWGASVMDGAGGRIGTFFLLVGSVLYLMGILRREDIRWICGLLKGKRLI